MPGDLLHRVGRGPESRTTPGYHLPKAQIRKSSHKLALGFKSMRKADPCSPLLSLWPQVIKGTVNIQVGDVNDNAPRFHNQPYSVRIPEVGIAAAWLLPLPSVATLAAWWPPQSWLPEGHQRMGLSSLPWTLAVAEGRIKPLGVIAAWKGAGAK